MSRQVDVKALISHIVRGDGADKCRICMGDTSEGQVFLGDTVMMDGDKAVTLAELLEIITGVEVSQDEDLPNWLCSTCSVSAFMAAEFRTLCRRAVDQWEIILEMLNRVTKVECSKHTQKMYAVFKDNNILIIESPSEEKTSMKNASKTKQIKYRQGYAKSLRCHCPNCNKNFLYAHDLYKHLKESSDMQRACYVCAEIMTRDDLVKHLAQKHKRMPYDCKKCPALFRSRKQYQQHLYEAHVSGACTCGDCGRSFHTYPAFHAHLSVHTQKNCPGCSKLFRNQTCYFFHVKQCCNLDRNRQDTHHTKHKVTVFVENKNKRIKVGMRGSADTECICDHCGKKFASKKFLSAHIQIVHLKNTHKPCIYCGKYLAAAHMPTHVKKHTSSETYKCEQCGVVLKSKLGYSQHLRLHTGEKPYPCHYCDECFSASSRRSEHIRKIHKKTEIVLKHACQLCPAKFRLPYRLKKHVSSVHENKARSQYECAACNVKFASCRALLLHNKSQHSK